MAVGVRRLHQGSVGFKLRLSHQFVNKRSIAVRRAVTVSTKI